MGKLFMGMLAVLAFISGLTYLAMLEKVEAGYVGIKVDLLGTEKGVNTEELGVGRYLIGINEELFVFPTFAVNYVWTLDNSPGSETDESLTFQSIEGMNIGADIGITYSIDPAKVPVLFQRYRKGVEEITDVYLRNMVRDALSREASKMKVDAIYGAGKSGMMDRVQDSVTSQVKQYGILIEKVYLSGSLRFPDEVNAAITSEINANSLSRQRENEIAAAIAQAETARNVAMGTADAILIEAEAQAKANRLLADSLTAELIEFKSIDRWNGELPKITGGTVPMVSVDTLVGN